MEHDHDSMGGSCSMSMLWNWQTIDACFVSAQWHVRSKGIEACRRTARDYDRWVATQRKIRFNNNASITQWDLKPTWKEQAIRGMFYGAQFSAAYILMLIAMSYNGFILFATFLGGFVGYTLFGGDTLELGASNDAGAGGHTSAGTLLPLTVPICAFKANKIRTHRKQLKMVRKELERRALSTMEKRKRDVLVPVAVAFTIYAMTFSIADAIDIVPEGIQEGLHDKIEGFFGSGGLDKIGNTYESFILAEAATPLTNKIIRHNYRPGCPPPLPPRPGQKMKEQ
ncbi:unnamed protein product [Rhizoctonia solani]|uniref:Copper transport protein n=1 Tax=Rhizoctonia solani TaxID=456999 RepID=A0A8H3HN16_9AGAM|nr:unnamed protein product [Rhizoctonia solani]